MTRAVLVKNALAALDRRGFLKSAGVLIVGFSMSASEARAQFGGAAIPGSPPNALTFPSLEFPESFP